MRTATRTIVLPERDPSGPPPGVPADRAGEALAQLTSLVRAIERGGRDLADVLGPDLREDLQRATARLLQRGIEIAQARGARR